MISDRKKGSIAGILYIIGTVAGILSVVFTQPLLGAPDYLVRISENPNQLITGTLFIILMGLALALLPVVVFPILKKHNEGLALGYLIFRGALETVAYLISATSIFLLLPISQAFIAAGGADAAQFQALAGVLRGSEGWFSELITIVFIPGALMFYFALYQAKLVPRWLSGWGLLSILPYLVASAFVIFAAADQMSTMDTVLRMPLAIQEMVLAVWFIVKGFNPSEKSN